MAWHEPLVLFGDLAGRTRTLERCTGILIGPQRQTAVQRPIPLWFGGQNQLKWGRIPPI